MPSDWSRVSCTIQCIIYENDLKMNDIATVSQYTTVITYYLLFIPVFAFEQDILSTSFEPAVAVDIVHRVGKVMIRYCVMAQIARKS